MVKGDGVINLPKHWPAFPDDMTALIETWLKLGSALPGLFADSVPDAALAEVRRCAC